MTSSAASALADLTARAAWITGVAPVGAPALVGVSGGRDSVALLHVLRSLGYGALTVCHLHHGLRGADADEDERFVRGLAEGMGLAFRAGRADVTARAREEGRTVEEAARELRLEFFGAVARDAGAGCLFLGHQADDLAETMLFHLARGSGVRGLAALRPVSLHGGAADPLCVIRPLLRVPRRDIDAFVEAAGLAYREDLTNAAPVATRNRVRRDVLPALASAVGVDPVPAMARLADILGAEDDFLEGLVAAPAARERLAVADVAALHPALQRRLLVRWLHARTGARPDFETVELCRAAADPAAPAAKVNLPGGRHFRRRAGWLFVE